MRVAIPHDVRYYIVHVMRLLYYINSAANAIIYNLVSTKFRAAFRSVLSCRTKKSQLPPTIMTRSPQRSPNSSFKQRPNPANYNYKGCNRLSVDHLEIAL